MPNILHKKNRIAGSFASRANATFTPTGEVIPEKAEPSKTAVDFFEITEVDGDVAKLETVAEITDAPRFAGKTFEVPGPPKQHRDRRQKFTRKENATHSTLRKPRTQK
jgi:hypothetical protein